MSSGNYHIASWYRRTELNQAAEQKITQAVQHAAADYIDQSGHAIPSPGQLEGIPLQVIVAGRPSVSFQREEWTPGWNLDDWPIPEEAV